MTELSQRLIRLERKLFGKARDPFEIATADLAADAVTGAKIADDQIDSEHYVDGSIDTAHLAGDVAAALAPVGVSVPFAGAAAPTGWLLCDGSAVSRSTYSALFAVVGTTYGAGDGSTTFNLPNIQGRTVVGRNSGGGTFGTLGGTTGAETHTLTQAEMPVHSHNFTGSSGDVSSLPYADAPNTAGGVKFSVSLNSYGAVSIANSGSGGAHNNIQPSIALNYIIKF